MSAVKIMGAPMTPRNERTFRDLARELRAAGRSERTISAYHQACLSLERHLARTGHGTDLLEASRDMIVDWLIALRATHSPESIRSYFRSIRRFCNWAADEELIARSPVRGLELPRAGTAPVAIPATDHIKALLAACAADKTWMGRRDEAIIRLCCQAGAFRAGEVATLAADCVDLDRDMITVTGKTGTRTVPLEPKTARAFSRWERARRALGVTSPRWFTGRRGDLTANGIYQLVERRCRQAGVPRIHPHQFRHWATDQMLAGDMPEGAVIVLNGWRGRAMLDRYAAAHREQRAGEAARAAGIGAIL
jgi:integrase